jgi:hypothetical protein
MNHNKPAPHERLKEQWSRLLCEGAAPGRVLASTTVDVPVPSTAAGSSNAPALARRAARVRRQASAQAAENLVPEGQAPFAWGNWGNWHNGWPNGWRNWHNWRNW